MNVEIEERIQREGMRDKGVGVGYSSARGSAYSIGRSTNSLDAPTPY